MHLSLHNIGRLFVLKGILFLGILVASSSISQSQAYSPKEQAMFFQGMDMGQYGEIGDLEKVPSLKEIISKASVKYGLDPRLLEAVIRVESNFDVSATSPKGAIGLMQILPSSMPNLSKEELLDPYINVMIGAAYLRELLDTFDSDLELALAAYNAGVATVRSYGGLPPFPETKAYVRKVLAYLSERSNH